jgi:hypothetical protein
MMTLWFIGEIEYEKLFSNILNHYVLEVFTIIFGIINMYVLVCAILINLYFVIKNMSFINVEKILIILNKKTNLYNKFLYKELNSPYEKSNKYYEINKNSKNLLVKIIPHFIFDTITNVLSFLLLLISFFLTPIYILVKGLLSLIIKIFSTNENKIIFFITKLSITLTLFGMYCIIQKENIFQERIIAVFEFISTAILIPLVLDSILSINKKVFK